MTIELLFGARQLSFCMVAWKDGLSWPSYLLALVFKVLRMWIAFGKLSVIFPF